MYFIDPKLDLGVIFFWILDFVCDFKFDILILNLDLNFVRNQNMDFDRSLNSPKHWKYLYIGFD